VATKSCFVIMGFGVKTDFETGRVLDLDKCFRTIIKPAVEAAGLECVRADEILHAGVIDVPMYRHLLEADVVVADLSTSNPNALYELGVRHALRPFTTITIAEAGFKNPFDVNHVVIRRYEHLGVGIDFDEVERFRTELTKAIQTVMSAPQPDSPVYVFLHELQPPRIDVGGGLGAPATAAETESEPSGGTLSELLERAASARSADPTDWATAKAVLQAAHVIAPADSYVIQQLALATYKAKVPSPREALAEAKRILAPLQPTASNDPETLGIWGAIHKQEWDQDRDRQALDTAISAYERGFELRGDHYNGINVAYLLNERAAVSGLADAVTDFVLAQRIRRRVRDTCERLLATSPNLSADERYWLLATLAESLVGLGMEDEGGAKLEEARPLATGWMIATTATQLENLRRLLAASPLDELGADGST